jgi:hypothetical protein
VLGPKENIKLCFQTGKIIAEAFQLIKQAYVTMLTASVG